MDANTLNTNQIQYLQNHVRLLSGLYGLMRPLDLMQPYRLEMGTAFANLRGKNLYEFWGDIITNLLNDTLAQAGSNTLVNLASQEYFKS
ncbi:peroxide stress protein YaaA, partial [Shigella sonnei]|nr:peroxide stress protein YaaA [Shigella sonnei]